MSLKRSSLFSSQKSVMAIPARPLGLAEFRYVEQALAGVAPDWSVELDDVCPEDATLVVLPDGGDDEARPSFVISREGFGFRLDQLHWDVMQEIGIFGRLSEVIAAVHVRLAFNAGPRVGVPLTMH